MKSGIVLHLSMKYSGITQYNITFEVSERRHVDKKDTDNPNSR